MAREEIHQLITELQEHSAYPAISIFIPTHRRMPERKQDPIRLKDLISQVTERLLNEFEKRDILPYLKKLEELADSVDFTQSLDGLALFVNKSVSEKINLPFQVKEKVVIDKTFALRDLIRGCHRLRPYWVLAIAEKPSRLFHGTGEYLEEVVSDPELQENEQGFPFQHNYDVTSERERFASGTGDLDAAYDRELKKQFMLDLQTRVVEQTKDSDWPLILTGTSDNRSFFKEVTTQTPQIIGEYDGDTSRLSAYDLEPLVKPIFDAWYKGKATDAVSRFKESIGADQAAYGVKELFRRASNGEIHELLVEDGYSVPGTISSDEPPQIVLYEDSNIPGISDDLVDHLIERVRAKGGKVLFVPKDVLKEYKHIGAILRY